MLRDTFTSSVHLKIGVKEASHHIFSKGFCHKMATKTAELKNASKVKTIEGVR